LNTVDFQPESEIPQRVLAWHRRLPSL
jgi:hypothetical protein